MGKRTFKGVNFSMEVYGKGFTADFVKSDGTDSLNGAELKSAFDSEVVKTLKLTTLRKDPDTGIMIPIIDSARTVKMEIESGRRIMLKDYDVRGEILEVLDTGADAPGGDEVYNGEILKPGVVVEFHWSEASSWGCVYNLETESEVVAYQPTANYCVPDEFSPKFRACGARGRNPELSAAVAGVVGKEYYLA